MHKNTSAPLPFPGFVRSRLITYLQIINMMWVQKLSYIFIILTAWWRGKCILVPGCVVIHNSSGYLMSSAPPLQVPFSASFSVPFLRTKYFVPSISHVSVFIHISTKYIVNNPSPSLLCWWRAFVCVCAMTACRLPFHASSSQHYTSPPRRQK